MSKWQLLLAPWKDGGRLYTYLLPPALSHIKFLDIVMVETPKGTPMFLVTKEVQELTPHSFPLKPVANGWSSAEFVKALAEGQLLSMHKAYPEWLGAAAKINAGEDPDSVEAQDAS